MFEFIDEQGTGVLAIGEEHADDLRAAFKRGELHRDSVVIGPGGIQLIKRFIG